LNAIQQKPIEGISFAFTLDDAEAKSLRKTQYFELGCNRGLYHDGWMASSPSFVPWDPYRSGFVLDKAPWANDLAQQYPEKLRELQDLWWVEAAKYNVLPLDWRATVRMNAELMGRPSLIAGRTNLTYYPGTIGLPDAASPPMCNKSWTITADLELTDDSTNGMIVTQGVSKADTASTCETASRHLFTTSSRWSDLRSREPTPCPKERCSWWSISLTTAAAWERAGRSR
jgi:hypothetical protein